MRGGTSIDVPTTDEQKIDCEGRAHGYGGAVLILASAHREGTPKLPQATLPTPPAVIIQNQTTSEDDTTIWPWAVGGVGILATVVIVALAVAGSADADTIVTGPTFDDFD